MMAGLTDMEELLERIENKASVDYMREAIRCYHASAYRGCIVLSYIALFDDLAEKLQELAKTNKTAKKIAKDVKQRQDDQQIFETYMVDQLKSAKLLTEADASTLEQVRVCRNKSAHPSGTHASAEEARFVFFEAIDKFLSKKLLLTNQAVDALVGRLPNSNFFPTNDIKETKAIVENELAGLAEASFPYLVDQLVQACVSSDQTTERNAQRFIVGLAYLRSDAFTKEIKKRLVKAKADDPNYHKVIIRAGSANATILDGHDKPTIIRLCALLEEAVENTKSSVAVTQFSHPVYLLGSMIELLGVDKVEDTFDDVAHKIMRKYRYTGSLAKVLADAPKLRQAWLVELKANAGSSNFDSANRFAKNAPDLDDQFPDLMQPKDAFELIVAVCEAAETGAFTAIDLRSGKFSAVPNLTDMALKYVDKKSVAAEKAVKLAGVGDDLVSFIEETFDVDS